MIDGSTSVQQVTISAAGVAAVLAGTPMDGLAPAVLQFAGQYGVDPCFFLAYVAAENGFGAANSFSAGYHNWIDELCLAGGNAFASGCGQPGNGYSYAVYPDGGTGVQAAFWQFSQWIGQVGASWAALLNRASGNSPTFLSNALAYGNQYASAYPPGSGGGGGGGGGSGGIDAATVLWILAAVLALDELL